MKIYAVRIDYGTNSTVGEMDKIIHATNSYQARQLAKEWINKTIEIKKYNIKSIRQCVEKDGQLFYKYAQRGL